MFVSSDEEHIVPVLSADWAGDVGGTFQRVRLSPSESMLAATLKSNHSEVARCMIVRLEPCAIPQEPMLILDNVFSFGKTERHMQLSKVLDMFHNSNPLQCTFFCVSLLTTQARDTSGVGLGGMTERVGICISCGL